MYPLPVGVQLGDAMRFRGKSIRRKIVALLLVPLVSLTAIWAFATLLTGREASQTFEVSAVVEKIGYPVEDTVRVLQQERRQALVYLADPRASNGLTALRNSRTATDEAVATIRRNADDPDVRDALGQDTDERLTAVLDAFDGIDSLRRSVEDGTVNRAQALDLYNHLVDPCYVLLTNLHVIDNMELEKEYRALVGLARARELLAREDALLGSALVAGRLTRDESRDVSDLVAQRTLMYDINLPSLPAAERARYDHFWTNASSARLRAAEEAAIDSGTDVPSGVTAQSWDTAAGNALEALGTLDDQVADRYQDRVQPVATAVIVKAVVAGLLGLVALLLSLLLSVRVGRGLVRDLRRLRLEAHEASGVRLPSVMRRLSAGEQVDVETEVPRLEYDKNEIGEVGQALNTLQRAAVEAAVKQAELRAGVAEVFVNLARRSQVLLHKQLTLLDTMERRTEDTEELADLFRLDHLTTRMRRHAEGLVILSGAAPSRQWRRPVQLMDVVRAAVAEVEDYERIEVRRLARIAVTGPAVADLTHLVAELLENATVFSPPHTTVQVVGERVANGFTLEIHDRGLGMAADALLEANLRLAETPEFDLSDTDRLGLFVVSRLAQRQNVRVSLQPSPYGGTTAVVFVPDALLTDDAPDTNGVGFRLDRPRAEDGEPEGNRRAAPSRRAARLPGSPAAPLNGPVELEGATGPDAPERFPGALGDGEDDGEDGGDRAPFRSRRSLAGPEDEPAAGRGEQHTGTPDAAGPDQAVSAPAPLPRRRTPKLVSSHGRPVTERTRREQPDGDRATDEDRPARETTSSLPVRRRGGAPGTGRGPSRPEPGAAPAPGSDLQPEAGRGHDDPAGSDPAAAPPLPARRRGTAQQGSGGSAAGTGTGTAPAAPDAGSAAGPRRTGDGLGPAGDDRRPGDEILRPANDSSRPANDSSRPAGDAPQPADDGTRPLPRRVRQASLAPQLRQRPAPRTEDRTDPAERDAEEVRSRMASLQRGWQRGREENAAGDDAHRGTAPQRTTKGDGR
ncbi:histidine kinase [Streptomyces fumigatiscleroticus]|nr:histidine kinase [Streptomyces fumigatiscleroticus]